MTAAVQTGAAALIAKVDQHMADVFLAVTTGGAHQCGPHKRNARYL